jgi:hypothetical protein
MFDIAPNHRFFALKASEQRQSEHKGNDVAQLLPPNYRVRLSLGNRARTITVPSPTELWDRYRGHLAVTDAAMAFVLEPFKSAKWKDAALLPTDRNQPRGATYRAWLTPGTADDGHRALAKPYRILNLLEVVEQ